MANQQPKKDPQQECRDEVVDRLTGPADEGSLHAQGLYARQMADQDCHQVIEGFEARDLIYTNDKVSWKKVGVILAVVAAVAYWWSRRKEYKVTSAPESGDVGAGAAGEAGVKAETVDEFMKRLVGNPRVNPSWRR